MSTKWSCISIMKLIAINKTKEVKCDIDLSFSFNRKENEV